MRNAYILRGLPGGGKSTMAEALTSGPLVSWGGIFSTDQFFYKDGIYQFDKNLLGHYHALNQERFRDFCKAHKDHVNVVAVADNTNMQTWEMKPYIKAAEENNFNVTILTVGKINDPVFQSMCANRNIHGVDALTIAKMASKYEP
jgi:hypothetical protein